MGKKFTLLDIVDEFYGKKNKLENTLLIASQHLLGTQLEMFKRLLARNLEAKDTYIIGKNYSTNKEVYDVLYKEGLYIDPASREFEYNENFDNRFDNKIGRLLDKVEKEQQLQGKKIILLDDGGHLIHTAQEKGRNEKYNVLGIEQTSSGYNKIKDTELDFVNVARSNTKITYETPYIGDLCIKRIMESIEKNKIIHPNCLVVGCGPIGEAIVLRCKKMGIPCTGFDNTQKQVKTLTQICNMDVSEKHFMDFYQEKIKDFNIIIGATGSNILNFNQLKDLGSKVLLMSASSSDREFPSMEIRRHADSKFEIHEDREYKNVVLVNSGFPITFHGNYHEVSQKTIELTIALLYGGVLYQSFKDQRNSEGQPLNIINSRLLEGFKKRV